MAQAAIIISLRFHAIHSTYNPTGIRYGNGARFQAVVSMPPPRCDHHAPQINTETISMSASGSRVMRRGLRLKRMMADAPNTCGFIASKGYANQSGARNASNGIQSMLLFISMLTKIGLVMVIARAICHCRPPYFRATNTMTQTFNARLTALPALKLSNEWGNTKKANGKPMKLGMLYGSRNWSTD